MANVKIEIDKYYCIVSASGKVLAEGNADEKLDPASLTKIMTSYVVGQALKADKIKLTDMVTVGKDAWATGNPALRGSSVMFLKPGDQVSVADLNKGVIIQSGNDACIALADYVAGSQESFIGLMNGYGETAPNAHTFKIALEDQAGNKLEDELQVTINPGE